MNIFIWAVAAVAGLLLLDQVLLWLERRGWIYWRKRRAGIGAASTAGLMDELHAFLSPGRQHVAEEKERRLVLRDDDAESGEPLDRRIDLDSGRAVVRVRRRREGGGA
ncbi:MULTISPECIES: DUF6191 domain-containing protein [Kitasatospora]|uniref:Uncharacterized protein n=1 Tax=Kitasatospora cystarginea TaxID=58350 RepID=A0ABN3DZR4_9ACTN